MQSGRKISITLHPDMLRLIREKVESGAYASTSELIREALHTWQQQEEHDERIASIRARLRKSTKDPRPDLSSEELRAWVDGLDARLHKPAQR
jgi:antitoxin ParD1/3/4